MKYRRLGKSGLYLSVLSFGSWVTFKNQLNNSSAETLLSEAYDAGINFFDNAEVYAGGESEKMMGRVFKKVGWSRDSYCISSKVFWGGDLPTQQGLSRKHVFDACHAALKRFQVDYLDLFFCHRPDTHTPIEETVWAMNDLIQQGKVLYWGTSEWPASDIMEAYGFARQNGLRPPTMEQPQYNLFCRDRVESEYQTLYSRIGLGTTIWSPLASGILTGKYSDGIPENTRVTLPAFQWLKDQITSEEGQKKIKKTKELMKIAKELNVSMPKLAIAWCLKNRNVSTVILGASSVKQLKENLEAIEVTDCLTTEVLQRIEEVVQNKPPLITNFRA